MFCLPMNGTSFGVSLENNNIISDLQDANHLSTSDTSKIVIER